MAITHGYATLEEFQAWNDIDTTTNTPDAERAVEAASRSIDQYCQRHFWKDDPDPGTPVARVFDAECRTLLELGTYSDLVSITALATDVDGDGTFETTWAGTDYQLLPLRPSAAPEPQPYTSIRALGGRQFPPQDGLRSGRVRVTGMWGWPAVPEAVTQACLIHASRLYKRRISPEGVTGFGNEFGPIRLSTKDDPDVAKLLAPYRLVPLLVA